MNLRTTVIDSYISTSGGIHVAASPGRDPSLRARGIGTTFAAGFMLEREAAGGWNLGCGQGHLMQLARECGYTHVEGVDASPEMVDLARHAGAECQGGRCVRSLARSPCGSVDVVSCF